MGAITDHRVGPSDISPEEHARLDRTVSGEVRPVLLTASGDVIELPKALNEVFISLVRAIKLNQAVFLMHEDQALTSQAAADFLGISRQHLVAFGRLGKFHFTAPAATGGSLSKTSSISKVNNAVLEKLYSTR